ncbi:MAG: helix-turn-helix domain-containing protein [Parabacteroides sp.]|nr:helix-turn-helix domain-containing protein [Parabacteroides sp.]
MAENPNNIKFSFQGKEFFCSLELTMDIIGGKWKTMMIYHLRKGPMRSSELMRKLNGISNKMFSQTARELEHMGIIERKIYPVVPPKVEYKLTPLGESSLHFILDMAKWGKYVSDLKL